MKIKTKIPPDLENISISEPVLMLPLNVPLATMPQAAAKPKHRRKVSSGDRRRAGRALVARVRVKALSIATWIHAVFGAAAVVLAIESPPVAAMQIASTTSERRSLKAVIARMKYYIIVLEHKGGVGKSLMTQISFEAVSGDGRTVLVLDADITNKNMERLGLTKEGDVVSAQRTDFEGYLFEAAKQLRLDRVQAVVVDSAAGSEEYFCKHLPELARDVRSFGGRLIVIRPVTTSPINQENLVAFGRTTMSPDMGVLMVKNFGQGRTRDDFSIWVESPERQEMLDRGMIEIDMENAGALCSDLAAECGISIADIALIEPDKLKIPERKRKIARKYFTDRFRMFVARWLLRQVTRFSGGFMLALQRTSS